jgi:hypothetical protein
MDGENYSGAYVGKRNIVLTFGFNPNYAASQTVESLRAEAYKYFMPKQNLKLRFTTDQISSDCEIDGIVETVEPTIFSQDPEMQVSILCPMPYFVENTPTVVEGTTVHIGSSAYDTITYAGTAPTGFLLRLYSTGVSLNEEVVVRSYSQYGGYSEKFSTDGNTSVLVSGSSDIELYLNTNDGAKDFYVIDSGTKISKLKYLKTGSLWPKLYTGDNRFRVETTDFSQAWDLTYFAQHGGL